jgi:hypothetical protein
MGLFNTVEATVECPSCGKPMPVVVQFKYGATRQFKYRVGDRLRWGFNDVGSSRQERVIVEGIGGPCPGCGADDLEFDVVVIDGVITAVQPVGAIRPNPSSEGRSACD